MNYYDAGFYDVIVVGAGHAGIEAALAPARMNKKTLLLTLNLESIGFMPCNPSIGGTSKGHLIREIDALGGQMGIAADETFIQIKMLNRGKGPAVHSLRAQIDKKQYHLYMKRLLENTPNLDIKMDEATGLWIENGRICGILTAYGARIRCKAVILSTGVYLKGKVIIATEYQNLSKKWVDSKKIDGTIFRTWGTSEGFVQDTDDSIAQILIDNTSTGSSLKANRLKIVDTLMESSTRMYASKEAMANPEKKQKILELKMLFETVLNARSRVMLEMNVSKNDFDKLMKGIPSMKSPTVSPLFNDDGFAVKIAVKKSEVPTLLPKLQSLGATDIVEYELRKVML